jgi:hypothetical protein
MLFIVLMNLGETGSGVGGLAMMGLFVLSYFLVVLEGTFRLLPI